MKLPHSVYEIGIFRFIFCQSLRDVVMLNKHAINMSVATFFLDNWQAVVLTGRKFQHLCEDK